MVSGCEYSHPDAEVLETHISYKHPAKCLAADLLWLNSRGEDVVPEHCACTFSRQFHQEDGVTVWVRVSAVVSTPLWVQFGRLFAPTSNSLQVLMWLSGFCSFRFILSRSHI